MLGTEDSLHIGEALPSDRCHLDNSAVRINRHHRDDSAVREEDVVECTVGVHQDLRALATNLFKVRHKPLELRGASASKYRLRGQFDEAFAAIRSRPVRVRPVNGPPARSRSPADAVEKKEPRRGGSGGEGLVRAQLTAAGSVTSGSIACCAPSMHFLAVANLVKIAHLGRFGLKPSPPRSHKPVSG